MYKYNLKSSHKGDRRKGEYRNCLGCGTVFWVQMNLIKIGKGKYHATDCYNITKNKLIKRNCNDCGKSFDVLLMAKDRTTRCRICYGKNSTWGYIPPRKDARAWQKLRSQILLRDNNECQLCGSREQLRGHHIKRWNSYPELRLEARNIIIICKRCDFKFVINREEEWESYFNFNLKTRGYIEDEHLRKEVGDYGRQL